MDDKRGRFEAQVVPHLDAAYRFARWLGGAPASSEADDIVQEAFLRAYRAFDNLRGHDAKAWLFRIVRNCHADAYRSRERRAHVPLPADGEAAAELLVCESPGPEAESIVRDERRMLDELLARLPAQQREVLLLRELEEMSYSQIASVTDTPIGTVMSRLARARDALRQHWTVSPYGHEHGLR
jgi:RNA polymerase sigma factor (sigma-70 family)